MVFSLSTLKYQAWRIKLVMHYLDTQDATPLQQNEEAATSNTEMHTLNALEENIHLMS